MLKMTPNSKCGCSNIKYDDGSRLVGKKKPKAIKQVSEKKKDRIKTNGSEVTLFKKIYKAKFKEGENKCIICREEITEENVSPACFPHILPKGTYPEFRYFESNLQYMVCGIKHHNKYDAIINKVKDDIGLEALKKIIMKGGKVDLSKYIDL